MKTKHYTFLFSLVALLVCVPALLYAQEQDFTYVTLLDMPLGQETGNFNAYINYLYAMSIGIAGLLAVIKMVIAGVKWMLTDVVTRKEDAKKDIQGALLGLLVVLGAVLILTVINPTILNVTLNLEEIGEATYVPPTSNSTYTRKDGDQLYVIPDRNNCRSYSCRETYTQTQKESMCTNVNQSKCNSTRSYYCYAGEYYPGERGQDLCIVRKEKHVKKNEEIPCIKLTSATRRKPATYDCAQAEQRCRDAKYTPNTANSTVTCK